MKRILLFSLMCLITATAFGQGKLIESSEDKRPVWIKRNVDRYDIMKVDQQSTISLHGRNPQQGCKLTVYQEYF